jgi:hydrogenase-4 membrane subunit HyfE
MPDQVVIHQSAIMLSYVMVIMALLISASTTVKNMVAMYRWQAWVLTVIVLLTGLEPGRTGWALPLLAVLPASLAVLVPRLLARASLTSAVLAPTSSARPNAGPRDRARAMRAALRAAPARADLIWLQHGQSRLSGGPSAGIDMVLIAASVLVSGRLLGHEGGSTPLPGGIPTLSVSMALLLQGLFTMGNKRDIIAQVIGLLVMEHGLFLAAVRIVPAALALLFVMSLFFYVLITLTILVWILPELHRASNSIEVSDNSRLRG